MRLLSLQEAADALGYSVKGLRRIVERSRAKSLGVRTRGPTIRFFQPAKGSPIRFRPEWIEEFINQNTIAPESSSARSKEASKSSGMDRSFFNV